MVFKGLIAATASVALMVTPAVAAAQSSAAAAAEVAPASETVDEGDQLRGGGFLIPLIALIAIILGICAATDVCGGGDDELPESP